VDDRALTDLCALGGGVTSAVRQVGVRRSWCR